MWPGPARTGHSSALLTVEVNRLQEETALTKNHRVFALHFSS
jgi:hypothetical protein